MDLESFFGTPRWNILEIIAKRPSSPIELSAALKTSVSFISQQLRLLEVAGIVRKEKTGLVERGKPRNLFSLTREFLYLTALTKDSQKKKMIPLSPNHKAILSIWLIDDEKLHSILQKFYWSIEEDIGEVEGFFVQESGEGKAIIFTDSKKVKDKAQTFFKKSDSSLHLVVYPSSQVQKNELSNYTPIIKRGVSNVS